MDEKGEQKGEQKVPNAVVWLLEEECRDLEQLIGHGVLDPEMRATCCRLDKVRARLRTALAGFEQLRAAQESAS